MTAPHPVDLQKLEARYIRLSRVAKIYRRQLRESQRRLAETRVELQRTWESASTRRMLDRDRIELLQHKLTQVPELTFRTRVGYLVIGSILGALLTGYLSR
jgi:hypothetical protein